MSEWKNGYFLDYIELNPKVVLKKGDLYPFVDMASVDSITRIPISIELKQYTSGVKFQELDTVFARIEPCLQNGKRFLFKDFSSGFGSTEFLVFRAIKNKTTPLFVYYYMQTHRIKNIMINSMTGATGRQRVNNDVFNHLTVKIPSLSIQNRIAEILSHYDSLIENYQKQIKLLEESAQRLYKEWFVDLRFPGHENTKIVDGVPEGWDNIKVGDLLCKIKKTKQVPTNCYQKTGRIPIIDQSKDYIAGFTDDNECLIKVEKIPYIVFGDHTRILKYINFSFAKGADGTQLIMSNDQKRMPQSLLYCSLINIDLSDYSYARHFKYLKEEKILLPSEGIAKKYNEMVSPIYINIKNYRTQIHKLIEARDRLLPKLMNGEIEV